MVAVEALLNLGVKFDELPKLPDNIRTEWFDFHFNFILTFHCLFNTIFFNFKG